MKVANIVKLEAILFMQIWWSKRQNSTWKPANRIQHTLFMLKVKFPTFTKASFPEMALI